MNTSKIILAANFSEINHVRYRPENGHISACSNTALADASGEFVGLVDNDDLLAPNALYEVALALNEDRGLDLIYTDEDKLGLDGRREYPHFKSDFAPESFSSGNYLCHFSVIRRSLLNEIGGFRPGYEGAQDFDLLLRVSEHTDRIRHIPMILYYWRMIFIRPQKLRPKFVNKIHQIPIQHGIIRAYGMIILIFRVHASAGE